MTVFPKGKHDDQVDSTAQFLDWFERPFPGQTAYALPRSVSHSPFFRRSRRANRSLWSWPSYGVGYDPAWRGRRKLSGGKLARGKVLNDDRADWREAYALFPGDVAYVWHGALYSDVVADGPAAGGLELRAQIIWVKQHFTLSRGDYHWMHETCWYTVRKGKTSHWHGDRKQMTVWEFPKQQPVRQSAARADLGTRHAEASRVHAPPDRQQQPAWGTGL
jgi:hypothetical protein